ncbi:MAG TPA: hypothetical protein PKB07_23300, partial [Flavilitoribacter sp.]|nr:hypothetical protein [Flavilitoribacter sp.]
VYGCLWLFMVVYGCLWLFVVVYGSSIPQFLNSSIPRFLNSSLPQFLEQKKPPPGRPLEKRQSIFGKDARRLN